MPPSLIPVLLVTHVALAVTLFLPSVLLPFALRTNRATVDSSSPVVRGMIGLQGQGTAWVGAGLILSGVGLIAGMGISVLGRPWLMAALTVYALNLAVAFFVQRPNLRPLLGIRASVDDRIWAVRARRQRYVSYVMAAMVGIIGFLMSAKPLLW